MAQATLGFRYGRGRGVPQDDAEAARWIRLAADQGYSIAQWNLGFMYGNGDGVPQDYVQAHMWFNRLASQSTGEERDNAVRERDRVADLMTPTQLAEAQRLFHEWGHAHPREP